MTKAAAMGYMILAAQKLGKKPAEIRILEKAMHEQMLAHSKTDAEREYLNN